MGAAGRKQLLGIVLRLVAGSVKGRQPSFLSPLPFYFYYVLVYFAVKM